MKFFDRSLSAGLLFGLSLCVAASGFTARSAWADERESDLLERETVELEERIERVIDEDDQERAAREDREERDPPRRRPTTRRAPKPPTRGGDRGRVERDDRERDAREREHLERERKEREHVERELREHEQQERREIENRERERRDQAMEREHLEREHLERQRHERHETELREREKQEHALNREIQELEIRRKQLELRVAEMEFENRVEQSKSKSYEISIDAIEMATAYLEPPAAAEFLAEMAEQAQAPAVKQQLRLRLAQLYFKSDQAEKATQQLRMLISPQTGGH